MLCEIMRERMMSMRNRLVFPQMGIVLLGLGLVAACGSQTPDNAPAHQTITKEAPSSALPVSTQPVPRMENVTPNASDRLRQDVQVFRLVAGMTQVATQTEQIWQNLQQPDTPRESVESFREELLSGISGVIDTMWIIQPVYLVFNPLPWERRDFITLDVTDLIEGEPFQNVQVRAWNHFLEPSQLRALPGGRYELRFVSRDIPAWAWTTFRPEKDVQLAEEPPTTLSLNVRPDGLQELKSSRLSLGISMTMQQILVRNEQYQEDVLQPGITIQWLDREGRVVPFHPVRKLQYKDSGPAFIDLLATERSPQGELNTEIILFDRLGYAEFLFSTDISPPSGTITLDMPLAFDPRLGYPDIIHRGPGLFAVKGRTGGMALFHDETARIQLAENNVVRLELPFDSGQARLALYPHAATETVSMLTRRALEYLHPVLVRPVENHFGRLHSALTFLEWNGKTSDIIPMIRIKPDHVLIDNVNFSDRQDVTFDLIELDGLATDVTLDLLAKVAAVNGESIDATRTIHTSLKHGEHQTMRVQFSD